jgi:hypothetical protein
MRWRAGVTGVLAVAALTVTALAAAGCSSEPAGPTGTVTGSFIRVGGPAGTPNVPLPGTISFRGQDGSVFSLSSDSTGRFTGQLPAGTYVVTAASSQINDGKFPCSRPLTAQVHAGHTTAIALICDIR